jgi:MFS family permease
LFSVHGGLLADRYDCRRLIQAAQLIFMGCSLGWGLLVVTGGLEIWHAIFLLTIHGFAVVLWGPAGQLIIQDMVGREHLQSAVRLNSTGRQFGLLFGPGVGGALMVGLGPGAGLLANILLYVPLTVFLSRVPYTGHGGEGAATRHVGGAGPADMVRLLREVADNHAIAAMVVLAGLTALLVGNAFQAQMPAFASHLGAGEAGFAYAGLQTAHAAGAVLGGVILEGWGLLAPRPRTAIICTGFWCLAIIGFAAAPDYPIALAMLVLAGMLRLASGSMAATLVQLLAPPQMRGRVIGVFHASQSGLQVGAGFTVGVIGALIGVHWSLGLSAATLLIATVVLLVFVERRGKPQHGEPLAGREAVA